MPISDVEKIVRQEPLENFYEIGKELGRGKFAIVKQCKEKTTGAHYAAKILKKRRRGKSVREDILMEIDIMRQGMDHNRIIKLYEVFESQNEFYIIIELAMGGELFRVIAVDPLPEVKARDVVFQILEGVQHLHALNIVHMDLKPENLLLYRKGSLEIKIVDFGLAVQLQEGQEMKSLVGTAEYVSPEILSFEPLSTFSDMWSIGALTYALLTGYSPFQGETHQETFYNVSMCEYDFDDEMFDAVSSDAKDFIKKLLVRSPHKRPTADKCLQHSWMKAHVQSSNLDGSMSSLDSALCMDSASSVEPSPVSSASSSFSPAPSSTSHSGSSGTTTTATKSSSTSSVTAVATTDFSRPEDMKKVNDKLNQISKLATEQHVADTIGNSCPLGSPTSSASSTGTLKGDETSEPIPVTSLESNLKDLSPREATTVKVEKTRSTTLSHGDSSKNEEKEHNRSTSFKDESTAKTKSTLDRDDSTKSEENEGRRSTSFENVQKSSSPRPEKNPKDDITSLDPKTLASLQRFERFKSRKKELEPRSPEPTRRDQTSNFSSSKRETAPVNKEETQRSAASPDSDSNGRTPNLSPTPLTDNKSPVASRSDAPVPKVQPSAFTNTPSPDLKQKDRERPVTPNRQQSSEMDSKSLEEVGGKAEEKPTLQQEKEKASEEQQKEGEQDKLEEARRERERVREERRRARKEEERKREEERQRLREEERKRMELERERTKEMRRREREKQAQKKSGSSSSSESLVKFSDQRKWAWSVEARTSTTQPNGVRLYSQRSEESTEETKLEQPTVVKKETERQSPPQSSRTSPAFKSERTKSSEFFQFCTDYTLKNNVKQHKDSPKSPKMPQKQVTESKSSRVDTSVLSPEGENSPRPSSPMVVVSPPPTHSPTPTKSPSPELRRHRERSHRERSPAADSQKQKKDDWRKTPVITTDAIDLILKGDIDEDSDCLHYANDPKTKRLSQLETFPEEDETPESSLRGKSPTPIIKEDKVGDSNSNGRRYLAERRDGVLPSSFKNPNRSISPEKRVTLLAAKERTQSVDIVTPERGEYLSPSTSPDTFTKSFDAKRTDSPPKPEGVSRLTVSSSYSSLSRSTPDLSEIAGSPKKHKQARKAERSHSRRMGGARMDSYITSTDSTSSYYQSPSSPHIRSGRHSGTLPSRLVGGSKGIFSKWDFKK